VCSCQLGTARNIKHYLFELLRRKETRNWLIQETGELLNSADLHANDYTLREFDKALP